MKDVVLQSRSTPDAPGYHDTIQVVHENSIVYASPASGCPNHRKPWAKGGAHWRKAYGWLAPGQYHYEVVRHWRYGKCLLVNGGGQVLSRTPNRNHGWVKVLTQVFAHSGQSATWRGSAGCPTIPPVFWAGFQSMFDVGESGRLLVREDSPLPL